MSPADLVLTPRGLRFGQKTYPCTIGRSGSHSIKREGDGITPKGTHRIVGMLYRADRMCAPAGWAIPIRRTDLWSDDPRRRDYNQMVSLPYVFSHEKLYRSDPLYDLILVTDWNWPDAVPGRGSAIFIHRWRRPGYPTEGCVALRADHLKTIAKEIRPQTRLIVR